MISQIEIISINISDNTSYNNNDEKLMDNFYFFFKYIDFSKAKNEVLPYQVPIWIKLIDVNELKYFENSVKAIIEQIDGLTHVKKIASKLDLDIKYVIFILYNLVLVDSITLVDIFQFSNIYRATCALKSYYREDIIEDFLNFCNINLSQFNNHNKYKSILDVYMDREESDQIGELNNTVLFSLFCELTNSQNVSEFLNKVKYCNVNIVLFIAYGVYKKIIRRVHIYGYVKNRDIKDQESTE